MPAPRFSRRQILSTSAVSAVALASSGARAAYVSSTDGFDYEVHRSEEEWRAQLSEFDYKVLRDGQTEEPKSNPMWDQTDAGNYHCKGCDLHVYEADWKVILDKGWLFFRHGVANALLMGVDWPDGSGMDPAFASLAGVETHCRRCGSHMGHIVSIDETVLHCINGASLVFKSQTA